MSWGELLWDVYPDEARLGGASANLAHHAAQIGCESLLVSRVGDDALGQDALGLLRRSGVDVSWVSVDTERPTGKVRVEIVGGEPRFTIEADVAWDRIRATPELRQGVQAADAFCFGTLAQRTPLVRGELLALLDSLIEGARERQRGPLRVLDLNLRPPFLDAELALAAIERAQVLKLNEGELEALGELPGVPAEVRRSPLEWLLARPQLRCVAVTRGARGAVLVTRAERVEHPGVPASGGDPVGAGDAFTAVLARELVRDSPLPLAAARACRYAAWVASQPGAQPVPPPELTGELDAEATDAPLLSGN